MKKIQTVTTNRWTGASITYAIDDFGMLTVVAQSAGSLDIGTPGGGSSSDGNTGVAAGSSNGILYDESGKPIGSPIDDVNDYILTNKGQKVCIGTEEQRTEFGDNYESCFSQYYEEGYNGNSKIIDSESWKEDGFVFTSSGDVLWGKSEKYGKRDKFYFGKFFLDNNLWGKTVLDIHTHRDNDYRKISITNPEDFDLVRNRDYARQAAIVNVGRECMKWVQGNPVLTDHAGIVFYNQTRGNRPDGLLRISLKQFIYGYKRGE